MESTFTTSARRRSQCSQIKMPRSRQGGHSAASTQTGSVFSARQSRQGLHPCGSARDLKNGRQGSATANQFNRALNLDAAYLSRIPKRFRADGLFVARPGPEDQRSQIITPTQKGRTSFTPPVTFISALAAGGRGAPQHVRSAGKRPDLDARSMTPWRGPPVRRGRTAAEPRPQPRDCAPPSRAILSAPQRETRQAA